MEAKCHYSWCVLTRKFEEIYSDTFEDKLGYCRWKLVFHGPGSKHLFLYLLNSIHDSLEVQYSLNIEPRSKLIYFRKKNKEESLCFPLKNNLRINWNGKPNKLKLCLEDDLLTTYVYCHVLIFEFEEYMKYFAAHVRSLDHIYFNISISVKAVGAFKPNQKPLNHVDAPYYVVKLLSSMLENSEFCDLSIKVGSKSFDVHKGVLASASTVFKTNLKSNKNDCIEINDFTSEIVEMMIRFIYNGYIETSDHQNYVELLKISNVYNIEGLREVCIKYFMSILNESNLFDIFIISVETNTDELQTAIMDSYMKLENGFTLEEPKAV